MSWLWQVFASRRWIGGRNGQGSLPPLDHEDLVRRLPLDHSDVRQLPYRLHDDFALCIALSIPQATRLQCNRAGLQSP